MFTILALPALEPQICDFCCFQMKARPYVSSYTSFSKAKNLVPNCMHFRSYLRKWINCRYAYRGTFFYDSLKFKLHGSRVLGRKNTGNRKLFLPASTRKRSFFRTKGEKDLSSDRGVKSDSQGWLFKEYLLGSYCLLYKHLGTFRHLGMIQKYVLQ